jgi:hypothetical protein
MAENLDNPSFGNFSIENTMEMGAGSAELLNDLLAPETSTSSPDDIKDIKDDPPPAQSSKKESSEEKKPAPEKEEDRSLEKFLLSDTEEEEDEEEPAVPEKTAKSKAPEAASEEEASEQEDGEQEVSQFGALAKDLLKLGVFSTDEDEDEEEIQTPEQFLERFQKEKQKGAIEVVNNFLGQFGEDYKRAFDAIFVKGVDPKEYFGTYNSIVSFSDMDLSEESNQVRVIKQALSDQGFEPEDIDTEVERLKTMVI